MPSHLLWRYRVGASFPAKAVAPSRSFAAATHVFKNAMPPRPTLHDSELHHVYLKGSGPGGQKINKTNSACQLTHIPTGIVVKSQATRSRSQNHNIARRILAEKIELLEKGDQSRAAIKTAVASKKKASKRKKALRKYRKLGEGKDKEEDGAEPEEDVFEEDTTDTKAAHLDDGGTKKLIENSRSTMIGAQQPVQIRNTGSRVQKSEKSEITARSGVENQQF